MDEKLGTFPRGAPREKLVIFVKMRKVMLNINVRGVSLFCKKCVKFPKKLVGRSQSIFTRGGKVVYATPFLPVTPIN